MCLSVALTFTSVSTLPGCSPSDYTVGLWWYLQLQQHTLPKSFPISVTLNVATPTTSPLALSFPRTTQFTDNQGLYWLDSFTPQTAQIYVVSPGALVGRCPDLGSHSQGVTTQEKWLYSIFFFCFDGIIEILLKYIITRFGCRFCSYWLCNLRQTISGTYASD